MAKSDKSVELTYGLEDRLPFGLSLAMAVQWLLVFLPILTVVSAMAADFLTLSPALEAAFFQRTLMVCGLIIILQTLVGHRLPITDGPSSALLLSLATTAQYGWGAISGGMIIGGLLVFCLGYFKLMRYLVPLFNHRVVGVILLLIALTLMPFLLPMITGVSELAPAGNPLVLVLSLLLMLLLSFMSLRLSGILRTLSLFLSIGIGTLIFWACGLLTAESKIAAASWASIPNPLWGGAPSLHLSSIIAFVLAYVAIIVNTMGSVVSLAPIVNVDDVEVRLNRGLSITGLGGVAAGFLGVVGTVPYSNSPGLVAVTRVGSRLVLTITGGMLVVLAFFSKLTAVLAMIPDAVIGVALLVAMAVQVGISLELITEGDTPMSGRDYLVVGIPVLLGLLAVLMPQPFLDQVPDILKPIISNGLIVGLILVVLLEHVILRKRKKRTTNEH